MKTNKTEIVFILDKSGSMSGLEKDTIGGFNSTLKKQKKHKGEAYVTTVLFDDRYELIHDRFNIKEIKPLTEKDYYVEGSTALLDAVGKTIHKMEAVQKNQKKAHRADKVLFVIITDGMENSSREFTAKKIQRMIRDQQKNQGWEFIFLGANIDAVETARTYGIREANAVNYMADSEGTEVSYDSVCCAISELRAGESLSKEWRSKVDVDYEKRSN